MLLRAIPCFGLVVLILVSGCKRHDDTRAAATQTPPAAQRPPDAPGSSYFRTPFQTEGQYIVDAIITDLAEQIYFAAKHRLPEQPVAVNAVEHGGTIDAPSYEVQFEFGEHPVNITINVDGPIWSPGVYADAVKTLAQSVGLQTHAQAPRSNNVALVSELLDGTALTIERQNQAVSKELETNFTDPALHEEAALVIGAFLFRDYSGKFFDLRSPLCRMTSHLAMAHFLAGGRPAGADGLLAEAMLLQLQGAQAASLETLHSVDTNNADVARLARVIQVRDTGDFRILGRAYPRTRMESVAWFAEMADFVSAEIAWEKLSAEQKQTIDYVRAVQTESYSVQMGHQLLAVAVPLEVQEEKKVYELAEGRKLEDAETTNALNAPLVRCFSIDKNGSARVRVIGWGQWANFLQRHLCHAVQQNFYFMEAMWGVPEEAKTFTESCGKALEGLRLYPLLRRFTCTDVAGYRLAEDDGIALTQESPQLVPAACWNNLCYSFRSAPRYIPTPNPHVNEWHNHNPLPGTVYDLTPRLDHPSLTHRPDVQDKFAQLRQIAPYDNRLSHFIVRTKFKDNPTYEQALDLYSNVLPYSVFAEKAVAGTAYDDAGKYQKLLLQAAAWDPAVNYDLAYYFSESDPAKAAWYYDQACGSDPDDVRVANHSVWRVSYYFYAHDVEKARNIADFAAKTYSSQGLQAKGDFLELTSNYDGAFEWYRKIEERYEQSWPLINFCQEYQFRTGDRRFDAEIVKRVSTIFPKGQEPAASAKLHAAPVDGVVIVSDSQVLRDAHMQTNDIIVALNGVLVHDLGQYRYVLDHLPGPQMDLIVWQHGTYQKISVSRPNHRLGVNISNYVRPRKN
jgi:hypothetical protein